MSEQAKCQLCGDPMPPGEEMFNFHGYSGPCPKPPLPPRFWKKKPVTVEARQWNGLADDAMLDLCGWCGGGWDGQKFTIPTKEGVMEVSPGDWIIKGVAGEFYPCKPDIFAETYERA